MSTARMDYKEKIQFAEQWLEKAKREFDQGSSVQAGSHIMLAIAEMETLKRNLFAEHEPLQIKRKKPVLKRLDLRPAFALVLFLASVMLFSFASRAPDQNSSDLRTPMISNTGNSYPAGSYNPVNRFTPYLDNFMGEINVPVETLNEDIDSVDDIKIASSEPDSREETVVASKPTVSNPVKPAKIETPDEDTSIASASPDAIPAVENREDAIFPLNILRETIHVANENLQGE